MARTIILILVGLSAGVLSYRVPAREIPPPIPWNWNHRPWRQQHHDDTVRHFHRGAVESPPIEAAITRPPGDLDYDEFGSRRYPLRDAVEALPTGEPNQPQRDDQR